MEIQPRKPFPSVVSIVVASILPAVALAQGNYQEPELAELGFVETTKGVWENLSADGVRTLVGEGFDSRGKLFQELHIIEREKLESSDGVTSPLNGVDFLEAIRNSFNASSAGFDHQKASGDYGCTGPAVPVSATVDPIARTAQGLAGFGFAPGVQTVRITLAAAGPTTLPITSFDLQGAPGGSASGGLISNASLDPGPPMECRLIAFATTLFNGDCGRWALSWYSGNCP